MCKDIVKKRQIDTIKELVDSRAINELFAELAKNKKIPVVVSACDVNVNSNIIFKDELGQSIFLEETKFEKKDIRILFEHRLCDYYFDTKLINDLGEIEIPKSVSYFSQRNLERFEITKDENAYVEFPEQKLKFKIKDMNTQGFAFLTKKNIFKSEQIIKNVNIFLDNICFDVDIQIKYIRADKKFCSTSYIYGAVFSTIKWFDKLEIINHFARNNHNI